MNPRWTGFARPGEETLASLLSQESQDEDQRKRLIINARRDDGLIELEFMVDLRGREPGGQAGLPERTA